MIVEYYQAISEDGGAIGSQFSSGDIGGLLPQVTTQNMIDGITIRRKLYVKNIAGTSTINLGLESFGVFHASVFESTGDAQVVGDITGSEEKFGGAEISKAIDTDTNEETTNGTGGLINIKKVVVDKNPHYTFFRVGDPIIVNYKLGEIQTIVDLTTHWEIELVDAVPYGYVIEKNAFSVIESALAIGNHKSYWVEVLINAGEFEVDHFNKMKIGLLI